MLQKSRAVITQDGGQRRLQQELGRISQLIFVKRMACFQKLLIFAIQPPHQEDSNFFPPAPQVTFSLSASFTRGYWRGKKKAQEKKEQKGKEVVRRSSMTLACCLQNSNIPHLYTGHSGAPSSSPGFAPGRTELGTMGAMGCALQS